VRLLTLLAFLVGFPLVAAEPIKLPLWEKGAPGFEDKKDIPETRDRINKDGSDFRTTNIHNPYVTVFLPEKDKATGVGVVVVPGGGHRELWVKHEGENLAQWLADKGIAAIVLRHRLPREAESPYKLDIHPLQDGQRALRLLRSKAKEWNVDPARTGMIGFSAGGEVVAMVCRKSEKGDPQAADPIDRESAIPSFQAHVYSGPLGLRDATVTKENSPPAFLVVGDDDGAKTWLIQHYLDLKKVNVSAELHIYAKAGHGFGFRPARATGKAWETWPDRFLQFLESQAILKTPVAPKKSS
jgi:acetyl esterase/lipase